LVKENGQKDGIRCRKGKKGQTKTQEAEAFPQNPVRKRANVKGREENIGGPQNTEGCFSIPVCQGKSREKTKKKSNAIGVVPVKYRVGPMVYINGCGETRKEHHKKRKKGGKVSQDRPTSFPDRNDEPILPSKDSSLVLMVLQGKRKNVGKTDSIGGGTCVHKRASNSGNQLKQKKLPMARWCKPKRKPVL